MPNRSACWALACFVLAGCSGLFGSDEDPLPGERISVMTFDRSLEPDPRVGEIAVRLPAARLNETWTQTGGRADHAMGHLALGDAPEIAWRADAGESSDSDQVVLAEPLVVGGRVFTMDSRTTISAFEALTGKRIWRVELDEGEESSGYFGGGLAFEDGRLYVTSGLAMVFALSAEDGGLLWSQRMPAPVRGGPAVDAGRVFAVTLDNQTHALAAEDGRRLWTHAGIEEAAQLLGAASPAVQGSFVVVPYSSGEIFAFLPENGRVLWNDSLSAVNRVDPVADLAHVRGDPVIDRGLVLAISHSGLMAGIDLRRGARAWDADLGGTQMPWVAGDFIYLVTNEAQVVCLTRRDGRVRWVRQLERFEDPEDREDPIEWFGPVLAGERLVLAGSNGEGVFLSPYTGEDRGGFELPGTPAVPPVVAGSTLYILTRSAELIALR